MPTPTGNENMAGALLMAQNICWNESHGYTTTVNGVSTGRTLNPDVDCSALVCHCLYQNGFNVTEWGDTASMLTELGSYQGFTDIYPVTSQTQFLNGDILVWDGPGFDGHTFFVAENVRGYTNADSPLTTVLQKARVEASSSRTGSGNPHQAGDQPKNGTGANWEVWVHSFSFDFTDGKPWHLFRWQGGTPPPPPSINIEILLSRWIRKRRNEL